MFARLFLLALLLGATTASATECRDGTESGSSGSGTCSHHGGEANGSR